MANWQTALQKWRQQYAANTIESGAFRAGQMPSIARVQQKKLQLFHHYFVRWRGLYVMGSQRDSRPHLGGRFGRVNALHGVLRS